MNCISGSLLLICLFGCGACGVPASEMAADKGPESYSVHYTVTPDPQDGSVSIDMAVHQTRGQLREISFRFADDRSSDVKGDGDLSVGNDVIRWRPARTGGTLHWRTRIPHQRSNGGYDAWLDNDWGIFRAEDIIPRARTRALRGAKSSTSLSFELPDDWSVVSEYSTLKARAEVINPARRFDQPRGWIAMGELGVRRETIAGTRIAVAAPEGQAVRRMDMLALLNWTLPELTSVLPNAIPRLTIVSAGSPMWRGALSAPGSIYIHADRPLISENATSTLVHEIVHVAMGITAASGFDWIVEGLAEYYSLELLRRGGAITPRRYRRALESQATWALRATGLCSSASSGATTALAVVTFRSLDREIRERSEGALGLDNVVKELAIEDSRVSLQTLDHILQTMLPGSYDTLRLDNLPGCQRHPSASEA